MKRLIAIIVLGSILGGCSLFREFNNPVTRSRLDTINASWGAALALGANYRDACAQRLIPPACRPLVVSLQRAAIPVQAAVKAANSASLSATTNAVALIERASDAINDYKLLQMQYGVAK